MKPVKLCVLGSRVSHLHTTGAPWDTLKEPACPLTGPANGCLLPSMGPVLYPPAQMASQRALHTYGQSTHQFCLPRAYFITFQDWREGMNRLKYMSSGKIFGDCSCSDFLFKATCLSNLYPFWPDNHFSNFSYSFKMRLVGKCWQKAWPAITKCCHQVWCINCLG